MTKMSVFQRVAVGCWMGSLPLIVVAGDAPAAPPQPPRPRQQKACAATEFRQFDFWLGDWKVTDPKGDVVGTNLITLEMDGCVLHEHWVGSKGGNGESFNLYDRATKQWHQTWVDNGGTLLSLNGGLVDGRMVLSGPGQGPKGEPITNRIAWEKLADGRVRQTWDVSSDGGKTWVNSFDGT